VRLPTQAIADAEREGAAMTIDAAVTYALAPDE
jgi:hypothetical protein